METVSLNLSRKWRSQNFDQIIGQDLVVRILKNSLYLGHYFPVYLFAGQHGCGKTSTARIFAAALNCKALHFFQQNPKDISIPCLECDSCLAMQIGNHPDFIEVDAASHTGVDNMRHIIESSVLLPTMGNKRVYLIDEAHMLSKAAFNAALKILEEPPATAIFILATTNQYKIIETVRSRCFQLFFIPIAQIVLKKHLGNVCKEEGISYAAEALDIIVNQTQGSARDALNMLEQVRFASSVVSVDSVLKLLGHLSDQTVLDIIRLVIGGSAQELLILLQNLVLEQYSAEFIWQKLMLMLRALVWAKHGVSTEKIVFCTVSIKQISHYCSLSMMYSMIEFFYSYEELFLKTKQQHGLLEMLLLHLCNLNKKENGNEPEGMNLRVSVVEQNDVDIHSSQEDMTFISAPKENYASSKSNDHVQLWEEFVRKIIRINHPVISPLFKQSRLIAYDSELQKATIECSKDMVFFKEWIDTTKTLWQPLIEELFLLPVHLDVHFTGKQSTEKNNKQKFQGEVQKPSFHGQQQREKKALLFEQKNGQQTTDFNELEWPISSMLLKNFPGTITEMREN